MRGSTKEFFNPVIPTQNFVQSRNPEGYFWHPTSQAYFQSRNTPRFCFQILNPELQISGCLKTYRGPSYAVWQDFWKRSYRTKQTCSHLSENRPKGKFHASHKSKITLRKEKERKNGESKDKRRRRKEKAMVILKLLYSLLWRRWRKRSILAVKNSSTYTYVKKSFLNIIWH